MNTMVKVLSYREVLTSIESWSIWHNIFIILLLVTSASAFSIIYCRDANRQLHSELQILTNKNDLLHVEWSRLLLEESTLVAQSRIQNKAQHTLHMIQPTKSSLIKVSE